MAFRIFFSIFLICFVAGCGSSAAPWIKVTQKKALMGTYVTLDICTTPADRNTAEAAFQKAWERLETIAWQMNVYDEKSDVIKINQSQGAPVAIDPDTYFVLQNAQRYSRVTHGAFDITIWPLLQLWRSAAEQNEMPDSERLDQIRKRTGYHHLELLDHNRVQFHQQNMALDLGGIAKGYAIDEAARIFRNFQLRHFFIEAGGDVYAGGHNCEGKPWRVGVMNPDAVNDVLTVVHVEDMAVTTSGNYAQYVEIEGQTFSHILNPITGYPQKKVTSATVIADSAQAADALSTALTVLGHPAGTLVIENLEEAHASLILVDMAPGRFEQYRSKNFKNFESQ